MSLSQGNRETNLDEFPRTDGRETGAGGHLDDLVTPSPMVAALLPRAAEHVRSLSS